eukprot:GHVR01106646.1.p1 GENE.GHVR01106646.1~~GHVR01106646.1.p1  ORF type:complete len:240 (+),score=41.16 GHVR01106646.1:173-892(+)
MAYETLNSLKRREAYDYFLDHPHSYLSTYYGFTASYAVHSNPICVVSGVFIFFAILQYVNMVVRYGRELRAIKESSKFKTALNALYTERYDKSQQKKSTSVETSEALETLSLEIINQRCDVPVDPAHWTQVYLISIPVQVLYYLRIFIRTRILKLPHTAEDKFYITRTTLGISKNRWMKLSDDERYTHMGLELWETDKYQLWKQEQKNKNDPKGMLSASRYKQWRRWQRKNKGSAVVVD